MRHESLLYSFLIVMMPKTEAREGFPDLVGGIASDAERLVQLNIELAKQELKELAIRNGVAIGLFAAAGLFALLALIGALVFLVEVLPWHWQAALAWFVIALVVCVVLAVVGKVRLRLELPQRTLQSLKETKEWVVHQLRSNAR
jgi:MFS family permease